MVTHYGERLPTLRCRNLRNMIPSETWATRTLHHLRQDTRRSVPTLSMTASMTADTKHGWSPTVTSKISLWRACTPVLYPYVGYESLPSFLSSMVLTSGLQILVMLIWKPLSWNGIISLQVLNLVNWKDII
jgi:hypothetical protein